MKLVLLLSVITWSFSIQINLIYAQETTETTLFDHSPYSGMSMDSLLFYMEAAASKDTKYKELLKTAQKIHSTSIQYHEYLNGIRQRMVKESGGAYTLEEAVEKGYPQLEGKPKGKKDKDTPQRIFVTGDYDNKEKQKAVGPILAQKIKDLRNVYRTLILDLWDSQGLEGTIFGDRSKKKVVSDELSFRISLVGDEGYAPERHKGKSWSDFTFGHMPVAAIYPMLRKFQNDAKNSEAMLLYLLANQMGDLAIPLASKKYMLLDNRDTENLSSEGALLKLEKAAKDQPEYQLLYQRAKEIKKLTLQFENYIDDVRTNMYEESGGVYTSSEAKALGNPVLTGRPKGKKNKEVPQRIFVTGDYGEEKRVPEGIVIARKIRNLKATYLSLIEQLWEDKGISNTIFEIPDYKFLTMATLEAGLALTSDENWDAKQHKGKSWEAFVFGEMPVAAIAPMLRKFQNDARYSEELLLNLLSSQVEN
jgi:hypothetical protein